MSERSKRCVLIINCFEPLDGARVGYEALALASAGYDLHILSWERNQPEAIYHTSWERIPMTVLRYPAPIGSPSLPLFARQLYKRLSNCLDSIQFYPAVVHSAHIMFMPFALHLAWKRKMMVVYDCYETYAIGYAEHAHPIFRPLIRWPVEILENLMAWRTAGILTICTANDLLERRFRRFNSNVIPLLNVPPLFEDVGQMGVPARKSAPFRIVYAGGISIDKGLIQMLKSLRNLVEEGLNVELVLIGKPVGMDGGELQRLIDSSGVPQLVRIVQWLAYDQLHALLRTCHAGLALYQPSGRFDYASSGQARKLFTYMQAEIPIICSRAGALGAVLQEERCGILVDPGDISDITDALRYLIVHPHEAYAMGRRGCEAIIARYNWNNESVRLLDFYQAICTAR